VPIGLGERKRFVWMGLRRGKKLAKRVTENGSIAETLSKAREVISWEGSVTESWRGEDGQLGAFSFAQRRQAGDALPKVEIVVQACYFVLQVHHPRLRPGGGTFQKSQFL
jgi:hypothetical protein